MTKSQPPKSLVLYADDDKDDIEMVKQAFQNYSNINLLTFPDGQQLLNFINEARIKQLLPCLVILDINMPGKDGKEVLRDIRRISDLEELPVILFSTSTLPSEVAFAKSFGAGFITKPLHTEHISRLVDQMIDHCSEETKRNIKGFGKS